MKNINFKEHTIKTIIAIIYCALIHAALSLYATDAKADMVDAMLFLNQKWVDEPTQHRRQMQLQHIQSQGYRGYRQPSSYNPGETYFNNTVNTQVCRWVVKRDGFGHTYNAKECN